MVLLRYLTMYPSLRTGQDGGRILADQTAHPGSDQPVLVERGRLFAPWNVALLMSIAFGSILACGLIHVSGSYRSYVPIVSASIIGVAALILCNRSSQRFILIVVGSVVLFTVSLTVAQLPLAILGVGPWLTVTTVYAIFRGSSYRDLTEFGPRLIWTLKISIHIVFRAPSAILHLIVGNRTWKAVGFGSSTPGTRK